MSVSQKMVEFSQRSSWIRKMFEEGMKLKEQYGKDNVFDFSLGNPDLPPPASFRTVLTELAADGTKGIHGYMPNGGYPQVRQAVAAQISKEQGVTLSAQEIIMTCGAAGALNVTLKAILDPGEEVIFIAPYFVEYGFYVDNHGGVARVVPCGPDFDIDPAAIEGAISAKTKAVIINSPNNPTGRIYSAQSLAALGRILAEGGARHGKTIFLIADEPYRKIVYENYVVPGVLPAYENSIVISSYSKDLSLPGERIGYLAVHPNCADKTVLLDAMALANRILGFVNAPALMQRVVGRLQGVSIDSTTYARRREIFCGILSASGYEFFPPQGAFYIFPRSPLADEVTFVGLLRDEKILAVPGRGFGMPGYFRLAFCAEDRVIENAAPGFARAMERARKM